MARMRLRDRILLAWKLRLRRAAVSRRQANLGSTLRLEGLESRALLDGAGILFPTLAPQLTPFTTAANVLKHSTVSMVVPAPSANPVGLSYSLGADAPAWATIGRTSGLLSLSPGADGGSAGFDVFVIESGRAPTAQRLAASVIWSSTAPPGATAWRSSPLALPRSPQALSPFQFSSPTVP